MANLHPLARRRPAPSRRLTTLLVGVVLLALLLLASLALGARPVAPADVVGALVAFDGSPDQIAVRSLRVPRTLLGLAVGAALGVAGAVMQGLTRNPVADPGLLGVSAGAAMGVVVAVTLVGASTVLGFIWYAFAGALLASLVVYGVAARSRRSATLSLVLAGAAVSATLGSVTSSLLVLDEQTLDTYRFWAVGSLAGRGLDLALAVLPFLLVGLVVAVLCVRRLDALALGEDVARALGHRTGQTRLLCAVGVVVLTGAAVAAAGPIAFVGLVTPHLVRPLLGVGHGWLVLGCCLYAPVLLLAADVAGRLAIRPGELPAGVVTALLGAPVLIWVVRRQHRRPAAPSGAVPA